MPSSFRLRAEAPAPDLGAAGRRTVTVPADVLALAALVLCVAAAWLTRHPYYGLIHDGRLYALMGLNAAYPGLLGGDLFLKHGSQDRFTVFGVIYGWFIARLGLGPSTVLLLVAAHVAWLAAAALLVRQFLSSRAALLPLALMAALPAYYGYFGKLSYAETFLTPRPWAEALGLAALASFLARRWAVAAMLAATSAIVHPVMALGPLAAAAMVGLLSLRPEVRLRLIAAAAMTAMAALALAALILPSLFASFDADWRAVVTLRSPGIFVLRWPITDWLVLLIDLLVAATAIRASQGHLRLLLRAAVLAAVLGLVASAVLVDGLGIALAAQAQIWRLAWVLHALAPLGLGVLIAAWGSEPRPASRLAAAAAIAVALNLALSSTVPLALEGALACSLALALLSLGAETFKRRQPLLLNSAGAVLVGLPTAASLGLLAIGLVDPGAGLGSVEILVSVTGIAAVALAAALTLTTARAVHAVAFMAGLVLVLWGGTAWDRRGPSQRFLEAGGSLRASFPVPLAPGEAVYWAAPVGATWFGLTQPSFFHEAQGAGVVFNRANALDYAERARRVAIWEQGPRDAAAARALCAGEVHPALLVLPAAVDGLPGRVWTPPPASGLAAQHVYRCDGLDP